MELRPLFLGEVALNMLNFCELEVKLLGFFLSLLNQVVTYCLASLLHSPKFVLLKDPDMLIKLAQCSVTYAPWNVQK